MRRWCIETKKSLLVEGALDEGWIGFNQVKVQGAEQWGRDSRQWEG